MSTIEVNKIAPVSGGTNVTLGDSGDTFTIPSGVTMTNNGSSSGFGPSLTGSTNNTVVTVTGADAMQGEANLTFDGTQLSVLDTNAGTDNLLVKTTGDNQISMAVEKSDLKFDIGLDHNNDGSQNFYIRERHQGGATTNAVRMVIDNNGKIAIGTTSTGAGGLSIRKDLTAANIVYFDNTSSSSAYGPFFDFANVTHDNNDNYFLTCEDSSAVRLRIWSDGDVVNHDNSYGAISDVKLKEQIVDSPSQWNDIKNLRVRKFKLKEDVKNKGDSDSLWRIGLVAQEAETVSPNLVSTDPDKTRNSETGEIENLDTETKRIKYSVLYMKAVKALQEAMDRIETLEARVEALENA